mmetsp:Transcript_23187/g.59138  ORF Transcript_23187/g.59138 Transcript_23187/m.59138 type:complete len:246 (-) Transcript_23187:54-791(-)
MRLHMRSGNLWRHDGRVSRHHLQRAHACAHGCAHGRRACAAQHGVPMAIPCGDRMQRLHIAHVASACATHDICTRAGCDEARQRARTMRRAQLRGVHLKVWVLIDKPSAERSVDRHDLGSRQATHRHAIGAQNRRADHAAVRARARARSHAGVPRSRYDSCEVVTDCQRVQDRRGGGGKHVRGVHGTRGHRGDNWDGGVDMRQPREWRWRGHQHGRHSLRMVTSARVSVTSERAHVGICDLQARE